MCCCSSIYGVRASANRAKGPIYHIYVTYVCVSEENLFEYEIIERSNELTMDKFIAGIKMPNKQ